MPRTSDGFINPNTTYGDLRRICDMNGIDVTSAILPKGVNGIYSDRLQIIVIDRRMTYTQKRCTLVHELIHHRHGDTSCDPFQQIRSELRARKETAMTLITTERYAALEYEYEDDPYQISLELDVTKQVFDDYRTMVLEQFGCNYDVAWTW